MTYLSKCLSQQIYASCAVLIAALGFSIIMFITPAHAEKQKHTAIGAQSATIAPQGNEATYVTGVNTTGTVRVNNLANVEALLYIIANLSQIVGTIAGFSVICYAIFFAKSDFVLPILKWKLSRRTQGLIGCALITTVLAVPGVVNWLVASTREANLFS